jgi:hypothetical protein
VRKAKRSLTTQQVPLVSPDLHVISECCAVSPEARNDYDLNIPRERVARNRLKRLMSRCWPFVVSSYLLNLISFCLRASIHLKALRSEGISCFFFSRLFTAIFSRFEVLIVSKRFSRAWPPRVNVPLSPHSEIFHFDAHFFFLYFVRLLCHLGLALKKHIRRRSSTKRFEILSSSPLLFDDMRNYRSMCAIARLCVVFLRVAGSLLTEQISQTV